MGFVDKNTLHRVEKLLNDHANPTPLMKDELFDKFTRLQRASNLFFLKLSPSKAQQT